MDVRSIPLDRIHVHDWRSGSERWRNSEDFVREGLAERLIGRFASRSTHSCWTVSGDLIINVGHVVLTKSLVLRINKRIIFSDSAANRSICASPMAAACCGIENNLGTLISPLRACYNKAENDFLGNLPDMYFEVVMAYDEQGKLGHTGVYVGDDLETYLDAARASRAQNITIVPPLKKVVAVMQGDEFYSTWVANKAIYRTRKAMADGGELLILAPGLEAFRRAGRGRHTSFESTVIAGPKKILKLWKTEPMLQDLTHGTAHLIHGSSEGRFKITYAPGHLTKEEVEGVCFGYADLAEMLERYNPSVMKNGFNTMPDGEEVYYISTPSAGLWTTQKN